jgi:hypothetical protein
MKTMTLLLARMSGNLAFSSKDLISEEESLKHGNILNDNYDDEGNHSDKEFNEIHSDRNHRARIRSELSATGERLVDANDEHFVSTTNSIEINEEGGQTPKRS